MLNAMQLSKFQLAGCIQAYGDHKADRGHTGDRERATYRENRDCMLYTSVSRGAQ